MDLLRETIKEFSGGWFNYRIVEKTRTYKTTDKEIQETYYDIHEVYYDGKGKIIAWTQDPMTIYFENYSDVKFYIKAIKDASKKEILKIENNKLISTNKYMKDIK